MRTSYTRGMRDMPTVQGLNRRSVPKTQAQGATELARLEHEKARLKRELSLWLINQRRTEERLRRVEERLVLVRQIVAPLGQVQAVRRPRLRQAPSQEPYASEGKAQGWQEISLEY